MDVTVFRSPRAGFGQAVASSGGGSNAQAPFAGLRTEHASASIACGLSSSAIGSSFPVIAGDPMATVRGCFDRGVTSVAKLGQPVVESAPSSLRLRVSAVAAETDDTLLRSRFHGGVADADAAEADTGADAGGSMLGHWPRFHKSCASFAFFTISAMT